MDLDTRWVAHFEAAVAEISGGAVIDGELSSVEVIGVPKHAVSRVMLSLDGERTLNEVAARIGMPADHVSAICGALSEAALIHKAGAGDRPVPHEEFAELSRRVFAAWKKRLFSHQLWQGLVTGTAPAGQFAGWLMENYHFIEGVNDRLGSATAYCRSRAGRRHFARHFREEYDHGEFFIQGLLALGFSRDAIYASRPLASTRGIINHMRRCARQDSLFYAACSGFLESTGGDRSNARAFFGAVTENYAKDRPAIVSPLVDHLELDEEYGHNGVIESVGPYLGTITHARASAALQAVRALVEGLELWSSDIARHYASDTITLRARAYGYRRPANGDISDGGR
jgi:pyrroloquinoline quinone (PQQ) biosynthesis protein C